jgi:hypothetical protein
MIVRLKKRTPRGSDLTPKRDYHVIGIEADDLRILNDCGRPYLYSAALFKVVDDRYGDDWQVYQGDEGETYAYPPQLAEPGFFEDYFDGKPEAVAAFWQTVNQHLAAAV